jgi:hypothetical protein
VLDNELVDISHQTSAHLSLTQSVQLVIFVQCRCSTLFLSGEKHDLAETCQQLFCNFYAGEKKHEEVLQSSSLINLFRLLAIVKI